MSDIQQSKMKLLLVLSLFILNAVNSAQIYYVDERVYYVSYPEKMNWYEAMQFCVRRGMYLVEAYTATENRYILSVIKSVSKSGGFWTGGTNFASDGQYYWASTGQPFFYHNWVNTNNNGIDTNCVYYDAANQYHWKNIECSHKLYFICRDRFDVPVYTDRECSII